MFGFNFEKEVDKWLQKISNRENISPDIIALNFGLLENAYGYSIYLIGSKYYDEKDSDWACNEDFEPQNKYFDIKHKSITNLKWDDFLKLAKETLEKILATDKYQNTLFSKVPNITIGFDDGDLEKIK